MSIIPSADSIGQAAAKAGEQLEDRAAADLQQVVASAVTALTNAALQISSHKKLVITNVTTIEAVDKPAPMTKPI